MPASPQSLLRIAAVAKLLGISKTGAGHLIASGALRASDVSAPGAPHRQWRVMPSDLAEFLARRALKPASPPATAADAPGSNKVIAPKDKGQCELLSLALAACGCKGATDEDGKPPNTDAPPGEPKPAPANSGRVRSES